MRGRELEQELDALQARLRARFNPNNEEFKPEDLTPGEVYWRNRQQTLTEHGYLLPGRYLPDWSPSWMKNGKRWEDCEDKPRLRFTHLMNATRISDNTPVMLKAVRIANHPHEADIARFLASDELVSDPHNHCVPIWDIVDFSEEEGFVVLVMPMLRPYNDPPFETTGEVLDFLRQSFQGIAFMHFHNVAHRDCAGSNIMLDPSGLYPFSYNPIFPNKSVDLKSRARHFSRRQRPPKYYFIDFGLSRRYTSEERPPSEPIINGADKSPPEHNGEADSCDPFPTDIYYLGNTVQKDFLQKYKGLDFLQELVDTMVRADPAARPSAEEILKSFETITAHLTEHQKTARLADRSESAIGGFLRDLMYVARGLLMHFSPPSTSMSKAD